MVVQARQIGVQPCEVSPRNWLPREYLAECVGVRLVAEECELSNLDSATFVGRGPPALRATKNAPSSPSKVGKHGSSRECMVEFAEYLGSTESVESARRVLGSQVCVESVCRTV